ncbi:transcription initiation factor IID, 18kD subunit-domain-containing protein [Xylariales sp. AK1849]|nr:transcription initiation factor IID, 18kD subunit-domain-containing protein [Xylariales sp. AK1849]
MEPRARAGKNVGKETFPAKDLSALMYAYGDVGEPLPETVRVMDEILTEFVEGICFEASRHATVAGRQKLKFDDFEFSLRRHPEYLGRVRTMIDKRIEIKNMRKAFQPDDDAVMKSHGKEEGKRPRSAVGAAEELLDDDDDDPDIAEAINSKKDGPPKKKKRKTGGT